jgi:hypothetical protein
MPATTVEQISAATTILRWVVRYAVKIEALFMTLSRTPNLFQLLPERMPPGCVGGTQARIKLWTVPLWIAFQ